MGNYYAGMMNNTGGYGELKHHGILGQKWGVRRWQNDDGSLTAAGKKRYNKGSKITRSYFESIGEPESIEKYQRLSRKEQKIVDKGVKDLRGPNEFWRGNYEVAFKKSILPPFKRIGENMTDARLARGRDALAKTIYNESSENIPKTGMPKSSLSMIADIHSKVTRDLPGGGSAIKLRDKLIKNSKTKEDKDKVYKNEKKLIHIIAKWAMDKEADEAEGKMNEYYDKENIGGLFVSKSKRKEYRRLQEEFRQANSRAWDNMANEVYAFINTLPKNQRDVWFAIAYKDMGLDW